LNDAFPGAGSVAIATSPGATAREKVANFKGLRSDVAELLEFGQG
jgi:hypothetical protein